MEGCVCCAIAAGDSPCHKAWEDEWHLAFLSSFPNTDGFDVVIPRQHYASCAFDLPDTALSKLVIAAKRVSLLIVRTLPGVGRTVMISEGFGVDHVHAELFSYAWNRRAGAVEADLFSQPQISPFARRLHFEPPWRACGRRSFSGHCLFHSRAGITTHCSGLAIKSGSVVR